MKKKKKGEFEGEKEQERKGIKTKETVFLHTMTS